MQSVPPDNADYACIPLTGGKVAFVDPCDYAGLMKYSWRAVKSGKCFYAKTTVGTGDKQVDLSMHRLIAGTKRGEVTHHRNRNSLDNRRANLLNMTRYDHETLHRRDTVIIKFDETYQPEAGIGFI